MIKILAAALRRQATSTIFKQQKPNISSCHKGVFRHVTTLRLFCSCTSEPIEAPDDALEYPLEVCKTKNKKYYFSGYIMALEKLFQKSKMVHHIARVRENSAVSIFEHDQQPRLFFAPKN